MLLIKEKTQYIVWLAIIDASELVQHQEHGFKISCATALHSISAETSMNGDDCSLPFQQSVPAAASINNSITHFLPKTLLLAATSWHIMVQKHFLD